MTLIGGQVLAGTPAPHGAAWFSRTQLRAASAPMMNSTAPVEIETSLAPGAAPWRVVPSLRVIGLPATMPLTWVPWPPPEIVSLSTTAGSFCTEHSSSNGSHRVLRLATTALRAVGLGEGRVRGVDAGVDDCHRDAGAGQRGAVRAGLGLRGLEAARGGVGGRVEELDRLLAGLDVA